MGMNELTTTNEELITAIRALPYEQAEWFLWRDHAKKRATRIGGYVPSLPCPATGKWAVVSSRAIAEDFYRVFNATKNR
jgi:hypothetical protein